MDLALLFIALLHVVAFPVLTKSGPQEDIDLWNSPACGEK
jgi:hypothetical protein